MKRIAALVLALMLCTGANADTGIDWSVYSTDDINTTIAELTEMLNEAQAEIERRTTNDASEDIVDDYLKSLSADEAEKQNVYDKAIKPIESFTGIYKSCKLDELTINVNMGTLTSGDFIALADMTYTIKTTNDRNMIIEFSETMANDIHKACPNINSICFFWTFPEYGSKGKVSFAAAGSTVWMDDEMLPLPYVP